MKFTLQQLAEKLDTGLHESDGTTEIIAVAPLHTAAENQISFLDNVKYKKDAKETKAAAVLIRESELELLPDGVAGLITENPYAAFARALQLFYPTEAPTPAISQMAVVSKDAEVHETARLEPGAIVYAGAKIGAGTHVQAYSVIGANVEVGAECIIAPHVTLLHAKVGDRCIIHSGARIGQDGFGFAQDGQDIIKIPQVGMVEIHDDVEIGANATIDRGALGNTVIAKAAKLDNQVQIAHNVHVGQGCMIAGQVGIAGSTMLGTGCMLGGQSGVAGHLVLAEFTMVAGKSGVTKSVDKPGSAVAGYPAMPMTNWRRMSAILSGLGKGKHNQRRRKSDMKDADSGQREGADSDSAKPAEAAETNA